ncbi:ATP-binding protein [Nonomuraea typhae]|uniref:ATP-binding protein n=1 Tax=Nonomuraea typhae TaxID=2603600 RepID=A0ABW7Z0M5_9ACTN
MIVIKQPASPTRGAWPLSPTAEAPGQARRLVRGALADCGWPFTTVVDRAVLVISELVTNAVLHGRAPITLELDILAMKVCGRVLDASLREPDRVKVSDDGESGRGLMIVDRESDQWWIEMMPDGSGKAVCWEIRHPPSNVPSISYLLQGVPGQGFGPSVPVIEAASESTTGVFTGWRP